MGYVLGIDLGDTRTSAAVARRVGGTWGEPEVAALRGSDNADGSIPTTLYVNADGSVLVGQAASAQAVTDPQRVTRGFVARVGDTVPVILPEGPYPAEVLAATVAGWVADEVATAEGAGPERIALAHPPSWAAHRSAALHAALEEEGLPGVLLVPSPIAAAHAHSGSTDLAAGSVVALGRMGAAHLDSAILRSARSGFELAAPAGRSRSAVGTRIDDMLVEHVLARAGQNHDSTHRGPPEVLARLRADCVQAKELLSGTERATVPVPVAGGIERIEVSRGEFDRVTRPVLRATLAQLRHAVSGVPTDELAAVLLAGGSAAIPLVRELAGTMLGDKVAFDQDPASVVSRGAALTARPGSAAPQHDAVPQQDSAPEGTSTALVERTRSERGAAPHEDDPVGPMPQRPPVEVTTLEPPRRLVTWRRGKRKSERPTSEEDTR